MSQQPIVRRLRPHAVRCLGLVLGAAAALGVGASASQATPVTEAQCNAAFTTFKKDARGYVSAPFPLTKAIVTRNRVRAFVAPRPMSELGDLAQCQGAVNFTHHLQVRRVGAKRYRDLRHVGGAESGSRYNAFGIADFGTYKGGGRWRFVTGLDRGDVGANPRDFEAGARWRAVYTAWYGPLERLRDDFSQVETSTTVYLGKVPGSKRKH